MKPFNFALLLSLFVLSSVPIISMGQSTKVFGTVTDSSGRVVSPALLTLIKGKDTLKAGTDSLGRFSFSIIRSEQFKLQVYSMGYLPYNNTYNFNAGNREVDLGKLVLKEDPHLLNQVEINGAVKPVTIKKDTIEYNALAYRTQAGDRVSELIKQLPGIMVDANGNVSSMGKTLTKIRVNGKDFFTGNVKEFLSQLPADLVSKVQVIDDYGDQAAFTGNKNGITPTKMLNLVTKAGKNSGKFGNVKTDLGTNRACGLEATGNYWQDTKQISATAMLNRADNGAGKSDNKAAGLSYRDNLGKQTVANFVYNYTENDNDSREESFTETITSPGSIYANNLNQSNTGSSSHRLSIGMQHTGKRNMIGGSVTGGVTSNANTGLFQLNQSGLIRQDLNNISRLNSRNPSIQGNIQWSSRFKKTGRSLSLHVNGNLSPSSNQNYLEDRISYYDPSTGALIKDSLLNRLADTRSRAVALHTMLSFSEPLGKNKARTGRSAGVSRSIGLVYTSSIQSSRSNLQTSVRNGAGDYRLVDSLSNSYRSVFINQAVRTFYGFKSAKLDYELGAALQPNTLTGSQQGLGEKIKRSMLSLLPVFNMNYRPGRGQTITLAYSGNSTLPDFSRLQPVPDTRNLQNITIGNPGLKAALLHSVMLEYNRAATSGISLQLSANANTIRNKVVSNTLLLADTLGALKRETRFVNANGNYNYGGSYSVSVPFGSNKYTVELPGSLGYSKDVFFAEGVMGFSKGLNFMQGLNFRAYNKWLMLSAGGNYSFNANRYTLGGLNPGNIKTWLFNTDARFVVQKNLQAGVQVTKTINQGYAFEQPNPLIINMDIEQLLFKNKGSIKLQAFDLLGQGNNLKRVFSGNTITDSRTSQLTRYFQLSMTYRLDRFGKGE